MGSHFEVKDLGRCPPFGHDLPGQGRLANLPGSKKGHHRRFGKPTRNGGD